MKQYYFLSGLQRSGSTLLGSLLNQNPNVYVSPTSPLLDYLCMTEDLLQRLTGQYTYEVGRVSPNIHKRTFEGFYEHVEKPIVIDKHRGWTRNINTVKQITGIEPKVICTHRPIEETVVSFIKLAMKDPENAVDTALSAAGKPINNKNRAMYIWENWTYEIYDSLRHGIRNNPESVYIVHYQHLVKDTQNTLDKIYDFLGIDKYQHQLTNINNSCAEQKDEIWGFKGLHDVRPNIEWQSLNPSDILDDELLKFFRTYDKLLGVENVKGT